MKSLLCFLRFLRPLHSLRHLFVVLLSMTAILYIPANMAWADETCNSPYMSRLIKGQEHYLHVWTLGVKDMGDGADKLVTIDVEPGSKTFGQVIHKISVSGRGEAHHMGFTDDRKHLWAGRLDDNKIFVFDVGTDPAAPKLINTIDNFEKKTGFVGPHTFYAMPGRMIVQGLSNAKDHGGRTGFVVYNNRGEVVSKHDMPVGDKKIGGGDGYGYDIGINPQKNAMLTSSFTGWTNYMMDFGKMLQDPNAMKNFGNTMVMWDLKSMKPTKVFDVPGAPLEIRWALHGQNNWAITATALTAKLWLVKQDKDGQWQAKDVGAIGDPSKVPLPVDISITADGKGLWVNTFMDGKTRYFDISNPEAPKQTYEKVVGKQANMVSQSWDGKRVYITSSLLGNWDKKGADDDQYLRAFKWDGKELTQVFEVDFNKLALGRAHHMKFSAKKTSTASALGSPTLAAR
jgi:methanethiol oxidase